jgi:hypothetical protein
MSWRHLSADPACYEQTGAPSIGATSFQLRRYAPPACSPHAVNNSIARVALWAMDRARLPESSAGVGRPMPGIGRAICRRYTSHDDPSLASLVPRCCGPCRSAMRDSPSDQGVRREGADRAVRSAPPKRDGGARIEGVGELSAIRASALPPYPSTLTAEKARSPAPGGGRPGRRSVRRSAGRRGSRDGSSGRRGRSGSAR